MLTEKAKEDFIKWCLNNPQKTIVIEENKNWYKSDVIEWLDSLQHEGTRYFTQIFEKSFAIRTSFMSFDDITDQAIDVCNNYYNSLKNKSEQ